MHNRISLLIKTTKNYPLSLRPSDLSESGLGGPQIGTRLPEGTPSKSCQLSNLSLLDRLRPTLENSHGAQPVDSNLVTHEFTTFYHGHHLLIA